MRGKTKLVLIGNGMAGVQTLESILKLAPDKFDITVFGKEPYPNEWYEANDIRLYTNEEVTSVDTASSWTRRRRGC